MLYKRPNFKMGGSPTGIETLTPRVNARTGFGFLRGLGGDKLFNTTRGGANLSGQGIISEAMAEEMQRGKPNVGRNIKNLSRFPRILPIGTYGTAATFGTGIGQLADFYARSTKTPEEYRRLKEMSSVPFMFDETNLDVGDVLEYIDKGGDIGEAPGFFPRGGKKKLFKDQGLDEETGLPIKDEIDDFEVSGGVVTPRPGESVLDAVLREAKVLPEQKKEIKTESKDTDPGGDVEEFSYDDVYKKQLSRLEKYLGSTNRETKGKVALALSDAVGTPGSLADKATVLNQRLLGIAASKKKDKSDLAKLAFAATNELEKAAILADKKTFTERQVDEYKALVNKANKTEQDLKDIKTLEGIIGIKDSSNLSKATIGQVSDITRLIRQDTKSIENKKLALDKIPLDKTEQRKTLETQIKKLEKDIESNLLLLREYKISDDLIRRLINTTEAKDGGRIGLAESFPGTVGQAAEAPASPVDTSLNFEELRTRLPKEITDDVVRLISTSEEALQDFAYIRTQGDVNKFNVKYGVNLILPQDTA
ncbi:hypothetical protein [Hyphomonas sp.]|uniref:hypothetical protein n=1 Tax=Hyphomonas sp. TaxID=87 RepID=UPI000C8CB914|nr:hypothetical protein [Hyphomonas sp.]MAL45678.1 hypothetical protein [Hyphomonas sp.]|tara:strand:- start:1324 stop:2931 length:1608 start_codon:yes stop_codon:yes gene_type:complete